MQFIKLFFVQLATFSIIACATAAEDDITDHPGYVDFSALSAVIGDQPTVEVNLNTPLLKFIANLNRNRVSGEPATPFIAQLRKANFRLYDSDQMDFNSVRTAMSALADELDADGWERLLRVRDRDDYFDLYFRLSEDQQIIYGSAMMAAEPGEATFANYVVDINVSDIELGELAILMSKDWNFFFND